MPAKGTIAEGAVKIALTGYEAAKQQLQHLGSSAKGVGERLSSVGRAASVGFAAASATMLSLVRAADPARFTIFEQQLKIMAVLVGRLFIPVLKQLIAVANRVNVALSQMTRGQMDAASGWGKWGVIVLGVGSALATVAKVISTVVGVLSTLWGAVSSVVGFLGTLIKTVGKIIPLGRVFRLLALAFAAFHGEGGRLGEVFGRLKEMALPVLEQLWQIAQQLWDVFKDVADIVGDLVDNIFSAAGGGLLDVFEELIPLLAKGFEVVKGILEAVSAAIREVSGVVKDAKAIYTVLKEKKLSEIPGAVAKGVGRAVTDAGAGLAKSLTFGLLDDAIDGVSGFVKDDLIGGKEDEERMIAEREKLDAPDAGADYGGGDYGANDDPYRPLMPTGKVQTFGVEEAFRKAQEGATFDPSKASDMIIKLLASNGKLTEDIVRNTARRGGAELAY